MSKLIIIRGNSGSGKSVVASRVRRELGDDTMLIPQDVIRREILHVADEPRNPAIKLIEDIAKYGNSINYTVIIEGILSERKYGEMLRGLSELFEQTYAFYFNISFEETLRRHQTKADKKHEFGKKEMRGWWLEHDVLNISNESLINETFSEDAAVQFILDKVS